MSGHDHAVQESSDLETVPSTTSPVRMRKRYAVSAALVALALGLTWALLRSHTATATSASEVAADNDAPVVEGEYIRFSDSFAKRARITAEPVAVMQLSPFVTAVGTLTYDPRRFAAVGARIHGRVRRVFKYEGDHVERGDKLAELESAELGRAEAQVLAMRAREAAAQADMRRERHLADEKVTPERDAELAQATFAALRAERIAAEGGLEALGGETRGQTGVMALRSPIAGRVIVSSAALGQTIDPTKTLFQVAELSSLWVELDVFERELSALHAGNEVEVSFGSHRTIQGYVAHVGEIIDLDTRTAPVRVVVSNADGALRPGQSVTARIRADKVAKTPSIPRAALTHVDGKTTVFVLHDKNTVEVRSIATGPEDSMRVAVHAGLDIGERVVVGGMFALKSEIFR